MERVRYYYLIKLQYLGFRYHGWLKQPNVKTVEHMVHRTLRFILGKERWFKIIASGRTDAKVSVSQTYIELFIENEPLDLESFLPLFNKNLPKDIRALEISETHADFNIIQNPQIKEYHYNFCFGQKFHPFCAPFMTNIIEDLDVEAMIQAAPLFEGAHDFWSYTYRPTPKTQTKGEIISCFIERNNELKGLFFPEESYVLKVKSQGFKRHQIRMMMGALIKLGLGEFDMDFIKQTIEGENRIPMNHIAPASGLILHEVTMLEE